MVKLHPQLCTQKFTTFTVRKRTAVVSDLLYMYASQKKDTCRTLQNSGEELVSLSYPIYNMFNKPGELKVLFEGLVQLVVRYGCAYFRKTYAKHYESHSPSGSMKSVPGTSFLKLEQAQHASVIVTGHSHAITKNKTKQAKEKTPC